MAECDLGSLRLKRHLRPQSMHCSRCIVVDPVRLVDKSIGRFVHESSSLRARHLLPPMSRSPVFRHAPPRMLRTLHACLRWLISMPILGVHHEAIWESKQIATHTKWRKRSRHGCWSCSYGPYSHFLPLRIPRSSISRPRRVPVSRKTSRLGRRSRNMCKCDETPSVSPAAPLGAQPLLMSLTECLD